MATAAVGIAPVLTPQTVRALAEALERARLPERASSLRKLQPFVEAVVERFFVPLSRPKGKGRFASRFTKLARDFEPFRLYLNYRLFSAFQNQDFVGTYERILREALGSLMSTAHEMGMAPDLLHALVRDYLIIITVLVDKGRESSAQGADLTMEEFETFVDWFHTATRFDYGVTAIFLILGRSIPKPTTTDKVALLLACKSTLVEFARATSRIVASEEVNRALEDLETPRVEIAGMGENLQLILARQRLPTRSKAAFGSLRRQTEINWLTKNTELFAMHGGKWIVLEGDELIASDEDYHRARDAATKRGIKRPFMVFVPPKETGGFMGI